MSEDIVKRLQRVQAGMANEEEDAVLAAIATIEALRGEVANITEQRDRFVERFNEARLAAEKAEAEVARLKAALKLMRDATEGGPDHVSDDDIWAIHDAARKALAGP